MPLERSALRGIAWAIAAAVLFAVNGSVAKFALDGGLSSRQLVQVRSLGSAVLMVGFLLVTRPRSLRVERRELGFLIVVGIVGIGVVQWLYFETIERVPVGIGLLLEFLAPVFVVLWVRIVRREAVRPQMWVAVACCLVGLAIVARVWSGLALNGVGVISGVASAVALAVYYLTSERGLRQRDPLSLAAWTFTAAALFWMVMQPPWRFPWDRLGDDVALSGAFDGDVALWVLIAWVIVLGTVVPYAFVLVGMRHLGPARSGLVGMAEPVLATVVAWWALGQSLTGVQLLGGAVVLGGIVLAETARRPDPATPPPVSDAMIV